MHIVIEFTHPTSRLARYGYDAPSSLRTHHALAINHKLVLLRFTAEHRVVLKNQAVLVAFGLKVLEEIARAQTCAASSHNHKIVDFPRITRSEIAYIVVGAIADFVCGGNHLPRVAICFPVISNSTVTG